MTAPFDVVSTPLEKGTLLLEASAGTGKTWSLTSIAVRLLVEGSVEEVERLLLVTFTRAATDELRQRLRSRLQQAERAIAGAPPDDRETGDRFLQWLRDEPPADPEALQRLRRARRNVDRARVRTIHSFCQEILQEGAFAAGLPLDGPELATTDVLFERAWRDTVRDFLLSGTPGAAAALKAFDIRGETTRELGEIRRHRADRWIPDLRPFDVAVAAFAEAASAFDTGTVRAFVEGGPDKDWKSAANNVVLAAARLLAAGPFDRDDPVQWQALFTLAAKIGGALNKGGEKRYAGSALETALAPFREWEVVLRQGLARQCFERHAALKEAHGQVDFDDVIARARQRLEDGRTGDALAARIAGQFDAALVDEFQDTDADQWAVFRRLFVAAEGRAPRHVLVLVGDPKQAIYRFRGADIFAYLAARDAADRTLTLTQNWRSEAQLVAAVNGFFARRPTESFALEQIAFEPAVAARDADPQCATPMEIVWFDEVKSSAPEVEEKVLRQLGQDVIARRREIGTAGARLAVLVTRHRQARAVMRALREVGVDAVLANGGDIHDSDAMAEWRVLLRALLEPSRLGAQLRARATRIWGTTVAGLVTDANGLDDVALLARLRSSWNAHGVAAMAAELLGERDTVARWLAEEDGERAVTDLRHGLELLVRAETDQGLSPEALLRWAESEARAEPVQADERLLRLDRESEAVLVSTSFASKGLQFDTVFLPFAWQGKDFNLKPPLSAHDPDAVLDFAKPPTVADQARLEEIASRLRLHYVELTRAEERCVVYLAPLTRYFATTPAAFLLARGEEPAGGDRAAWASAEIDALRKGLSGARQRVKTLADSIESVGFRDGGAPGAATTTWPRPEIRVPDGRHFPSARRGALTGWFPLSYTSIVRGLADETDPVADRADPSSAPAPSAADGIFGFARGPRAGICLHELLEKADFVVEPGDADRQRVERLLRRHDLLRGHPGSIDPVEVCLELLRTLRAEKMPFRDREFARLEQAQRLDEWAFFLPVDDFEPRELGDIVRRHWEGEAWVEAAAERLDRLPAARVRGMLRGYVDLLFEDSGRWTVLDWKSNDLGPDVASYDRAAMEAAMVEHDYLAQMLFYVVAAHRYLIRRMPGYDYERHLDGAAYVFLRGLGGDARQGWFEVRPPRALVEALDLRFAGGPA